MEQSRDSGMAVDGSKKLLSVKQRNEAAQITMVTGYR